MFFIYYFYFIHPLKPWKLTMASAILSLKDVFEEEICGSTREIFRLLPEGRVNSGKAVEHDGQLRAHIHTRNFAIFRLQLQTCFLRQRTQKRSISQKWQTYNTEQ